MTGSRTGITITGTTVSGTTVDAIGATAAITVVVVNATARTPSGHRRNGECVATNVRK